MARVSSVGVHHGPRANTTVYSYEGCGEGCEEEVNVDVPQLPGFPFCSSRNFSPFLPRARHTTHHCLLSRQFCLHDYDDLRRWVMSMGFRSSCIYSLRCCYDIRAEMIMSLLYSSSEPRIFGLSGLWPVLTMQRNNGGIGGTHFIDGSAEGVKLEKHEACE